MDNEQVKSVEMSAQELAEFQEFKRQRDKKEKEARRVQDREAYKDLVDETIESVFPALKDLSQQLATKKTEVYSAFHKALAMKMDIFDIKSDQKSHMFTNKEGNKRITLGQYETDGYDDTVNEGIAKVKAFIESLARDKESEMMVRAIIRLLSKDQKGNLKASRVMQLKKMATESGNETFLEGVQIIEESYRPEVSKFYIKAEAKNEIGTWDNIPLGMTEA